MQLCCKLDPNTALLLAISYQLGPNVDRS